MTPQPRSARVALSRSVSLYAAVLFVGVALFFGLHYAGNRIPYDLALERITAELESGRRDLGYASSVSGDFEYCQRAVTVLGAAKPLDGDNPAVDAVLPRYIIDDRSDDYCDTIPLLRDDESLYKGHLKFRYWWGSTPLYAVALRFLSDADIREWTRILTILAWGLLSLAAWFLSRRAFLVVTPLAVFASFFSGLQYFSDAGTGMPFLWTPLFAAVLAFVMLRRSIGRAPRLCCFAIGMGSSYLWLLDGHNVLLIALIGLVIYFGSDQPSAGRRAGIAALHIALYAAGFALCYAIGQLVKAAFFEWATAGGSFAIAVSEPSDQVSVRVDQITEVITLAFTGGWAENWIIRGFHSYWAMGPFRADFGQVVTLLSSLLFLLSLAFAASQALRKRKTLLTDIAWLVGLAAMTSLQMLFPDDVFARSWRYPFVLHGLCWSSFFLAAKEAAGQWREANASADPNAPQGRPTGNRQSRRRTARQRSRNAPAWTKVRFSYKAASRAFLIAAVVVLAGAALSGWSALRSAAAFARETIAEAQPRVYGPFNVHYHENRLVYERAECDEYDAAPRFNLHILPVNANDLPDDRVEHGFDGLDFLFAAHKVPYGDGCAAVVELPDYEIAAVGTGQFIRGEGQIWNREFRLDRPPALSVAAMTGLLEDAELLAQSEFALYRNEDTLLWVKTACGDEDVLPRFYMHVLPVRVSDLPEERRPHRFDNLDFNFFNQGALTQEGACIAAMQLPDYPVAAVRTGQFTSAGEVWSATLDFQSPEPALAQPPSLSVDAMTDLLEGAELLAQSEFDLYRNEDTLLWVKTPCVAEDAAPRFFLHLFPVNAVDLPEERTQFGFDNRNFNFAEHGALAQDGTCIAAVELPDYPVAVVQTGQFTSEGGVWGLEADLRR